MLLSYPLSYRYLIQLECKTFIEQFSRPSLVTKSRENPYLKLLNSEPTAVDSGRICNQRTFLTWVVSSLAWCYLEKFFSLLVLILMVIKWQMRPCTLPLILILSIIYTHLFFTYVLVFTSIFILFFFLFVFFSFLYL